MKYLILKSRDTRLSWAGDDEYYPIVFDTPEKAEEWLLAEEEEPTFRTWDRAWIVTIHKAFKVHKEVEYSIKEEEVE